jgi:lysophospholipase L1-like esterase
LGDSITVGTGAPCGYRAALQLALAALGQPHLFVGTQDLNWALHGFEGLLSPYHEGHGGYTIAQLIDAATAPGSPPTTIEKWLSAAKPDVVLLHAGTNDMFDPLRWQDADRQLERLLMRMEAHQPGLRTLVAQILPTGLDEFNLCVEAFNREAIEVLRRRQLDGQDLGLVDMYHPLFPFQSGDGSAVHPNGAQYMQMAEVWLGGLLAPREASVLPAMESKLLPLSADAFSEQRSHPSALLSDGSGLSGEVLHSEVSNGESYAWVSAPFPVEWSTPFALVPSAPEEVWLQFDLAAPAQVDSVWLWAGRGEELLLPDGQPDFRIRDNPRVLAVETLQADGTWISRGIWTLRRPPRTRWHPGERFAVNWSGVRALRLKVLEMDTANLSPGLPPGFAQVALGEVRLRGAFLR